jgi:hypothetical protein
VISITDSVVGGTISFANTSSSWLKIAKNSIIAADISTTVSNCTQFTITSGTFTHPNPWTFGSASIPTRSSNIGAQIYYLIPFSNPDYYSNSLRNTATSYATETLGTFNKDITIYTNNLNGTYHYINNPQPDFYNGSYSWGNFIRYTTFTGVIKILPTTGGVLPYIGIGGGDYQPTVFVNSIRSGTNYSLDATQLPYDWGFYRSNRPESYKPTIYAVGLPSGVDILATGI